MTDNTQGEIRNTKSGLGTHTQSELHKTINRNGWTVKIKETFSTFKYSRSAKIFLGAYCTLAFGSFMSSMYVDGKKALHESQRTSSKEAQWYNDVYYACNSNKLNRTWNSLTFPIGVTSGIMPYFILKFS
jgi:hypothetical protein